MAKRSWIIKLEDGDHKIELEHGYVSGKRIIYLDDELIEHIRFNLFDAGSIHEFEINGHTCQVIIINRGIAFTYDVIVDGISVETGSPITNINKTHFPKDFLLHIIAASATGFTFGFLKRTSMPFIMTFLISASVYLLLFSGIKALITKLKR